ncbi:MAG: hypothetical protein JXA14_11035, partial [Anaerolineae bacterium]|nr:hypothetical protein [Anaerolineae bacterium]
LDPDRLSVTNALKIVCEAVAEFQMTATSNCRACISGCSTTFLGIVYPNATIDPIRAWSSARCPISG